MDEKFDGGSEMKLTVEPDGFPGAAVIFSRTFGRDEVSGGRIEPVPPLQYGPVTDRRLADSSQ